MTSPVMKEEVNIESIIEDKRQLTFWADKEVMFHLKQYGILISAAGDKKWTIEIDGRYVFNEVIEYIESFNNA